MNVSRIAGACSTAAILAAALSGCAAQPTGSALPPQTTMPTGLPRADAPANPDHAIRIFTANRDNPGVLAFRATASGDVRPSLAISGSLTTLNSPDSIALDANGNVYVANDGANQVAVFAKDANGNVKPKRIIGGSKSQLGPTEGLFVDAYGKLWVSDYGNNAITAYPKDASGNVKPKTVISGSKTQLSTPTGIVWGTYGSTYAIYVANAGGGSVLAFNTSAHGNVAPIASISGSNTGLSRPFALAFDSTGRLLVADESAGVLIFAPGANGNVAPVAHITGFAYPAGVTTDAQDDIYVADFSGQSIEEFSSNANGNATPIRTIHGPKTTLNGPNYLVLR